MIWGILIVLIVVCLGFLAWLFCIAPASPRGDFAEMKKYDYAHRGLHEKIFPCRKTPWQALRRLWKRATA